MEEKEKKTTDMIKVRKRIKFISNNSKINKLSI